MKLNNKLILLLTVISNLIISGEAFSQALKFDDNPTKNFDASKNPRVKMEVTWLAVQNVQAECEKASREVGNNGFGYDVNACSFWKENNCLVITKEKVSMHTLGHEIRHCFQGSWH